MGHICSVCGEPCPVCYGEDRCILCHAEGPDMRTLRVAMFYAVEEVLPEARLEERFYTLRFCKSCRGALLGRLAEWRAERVARRGVAKDSDGDDAEPDDAEPGRDIPVRVNGAVVMMTPDEFEAHHRSGAKGGPRDG